MPRRRRQCLGVARVGVAEDTHAGVGAQHAAQLALGARCESSAHALLTTPGAGKWYRSAGSWAGQTLSFDVAGTLEWLPRETIVFDGALASLSAQDLGGVAKAKADFIAAGVGQFGSGWCWIAVKDGKLTIDKTPNGESPLVKGATPILGCDVWEHSYYIDYRNARPKYLEAFWDNLIDWEEVDQTLARAGGGG